MKVVVGGSSGLIGAALVRRLQSDGHDVLRLVRRAPTAPDEAEWDPVGGSIDAGALAGVDAVVHLGGASITGQRWDAAYKQMIRDSRVNSTRLLSETIAGFQPKPSVFLCASALGYYGDMKDEIATENTPKGRGFLADVTAEWEAATVSASDAGIRVCNMRIGVVLSKDGDLPRRMLAPFKMGLGGKLGNGKQYMSWVHIDDVVGGFVHALDRPSLEGPVNLSVPNATTNREFTRALARAVKRPAMFIVPKFALRIAMGEAAQFATESTRMYPLKLSQSGYRFQWEDIDLALRDILRD
ncbi:MAG: TIGR01777 family oxidoreductase [Chloroflexota bacterium]|nr:TIGR01777 family oxidoreductase [Chloroflexota bacterium]